MRTIETINKEITNLINERNQLLQQQKNNEAQELVGKYIMYVEEYNSPETLMPLKFKKIFILHVKSVNLPGDNLYLSFAEHHISIHGEGIIKEIDYYNNEQTSLTLNSHLLIPKKKFDSIITLTYDEYTKYVSQIKDSCNKLLEIKNEV